MICTASWSPWRQASRSWGVLRRLFKKTTREFQLSWRREEKMLRTHSSWRRSVRDFGSKFRSYSVIIALSRLRCSCQPSVVLVEATAWALALARSWTLTKMVAQVVKLMILQMDSKPKEQDNSNVRSRLWPTKIWNCKNKIQIYSKSFKTKSHFKSRTCSKTTRKWYRRRSPPRLVSRWSKSRKRSTLWATKTESSTKKCKAWPTSSPLPSLMPRFSDRKPARCSLRKMNFNKNKRG